MGCVAWLAFCIAASLGGFGSLAALLSCFVALFAFGFREKWADEGLSAYSVFNPGGKNIPGSFTAQQLDYQLRGVYGGAVDDLDDGIAQPPMARTHSRLSEKITVTERLRRREAAAAAAERRISSMFPDS